MSARLRGRTAVVTGVTSGIGAALAQRLVAAEVTVAGLARDEQRLAGLAARLGERLVPFTVDLAEPEAKARCTAQLHERFPSVDILVNNAAEVVYEPPLSLPMDRWRRLVELNLVAAIELAQAIAPRLPRGGHVINVSSVTARSAPNPRFAPYALTKAALSQFTEALRAELAPRGVKVTLIVPGLVDTPIYDKVTGFEQTRAKIKAQIPTWLSADDVAEAMLWTLGQPEHVAVSELVLLPQGQV